MRTVKYILADSRASVDCAEDLFLHPDSTTPSRVACCAFQCEFHFFVRRLLSGFVGFDLLVCSFPSPSGGFLPPATLVTFTLCFFASSLFVTHPECCHPVFLHVRHLYRFRQLLRLVLGLRVCFYASSLYSVWSSRLSCVACTIHNLFLAHKAPAVKFQKACQHVRTSETSRT